MSNDSDTERIRARLSSGGTAAEIAEEGYRVCRLNSALRRDLNEAKQQLLSPKSNDDDTARVKSRLDGGATAKEIAEETFRVCRINTYLKKDANSARADLRQLKKKHAITGDALEELRPEAKEMRKVLDRAWKLIESRKIKIPEDLALAYASLNAKDGHDWQARKGGKVDTRLTKQEEDEKRREFERKKSGKKDKGKAKEKPEKKEEPVKANFLLHTDEGRTYDMRKPLADQDEVEDDDDEDDSNASHAEPEESGDKPEPHTEPSSEPITTKASDGGVLTAENVVAGVKRKHIATPDAESKKAKIDTECWDVGVKLSTPSFPIKQSGDSESRAMSAQDRKVEQEEADVEEGEIKE